MLKQCKSIRAQALVVLTLCATQAYGQGMLPGALQAPASSSANAQKQPSEFEVSNGGNLFESDTMLEAASRIFDTDSDAIDFEEGTVNWKGKTFNMGDSRIMRARFERYLSTPNPKEAAEYLTLLNEITQRVQVNNLELGSEELEAVWGLLFEAAQYEMDAGNCLVIANQVYNAWRIREERRQGNVAQLELERLRKVQEEIVANRSLFLQRAEERRIQRTRREMGGSSSGASADGGDASVTVESGGGLPSESDFRSAELAGTEEKIRAIQASSISSAVQAKLEFQTQALDFLLNRRFEHVLITSSFYRLIFKGSAQNLEVGKRQLADLLGSADMAPTIGTLEYLAREAINDVRLGISAVDNNFERGERISALQRLQEAYFLGEYMPDIQLFDMEKKAELNSIYRDVRSLRRLFDLKDFDRVIELANNLYSRASDFPASQLVSASDSVKRLSDLALLSVQQAVGMGLFDKAELALSRATELWPMNPRIMSFTQEMSTRVDTGKQAMLAFDEIYKYGDFRQLYDRRAELGVALMSDPERSQKLAEAVNSIAKIEISLSQCEELIAQGQQHAAWEVLISAKEFDQDDVKLNKAMANLAPQVADYVSKQSSAERFEEQGQLASALSQYLAAQDIYPGSKTSRLGIERVSARLMKGLAATNTAAE